LEKASEIQGKKTGLFFRQSRKRPLSKHFFKKDAATVFAFLGFCSKIVDRAKRQGRNCQKTGAKPPLRTAKKAELLMAILQEEPEHQQQYQRCTAGKPSRAGRQAFTILLLNASFRACSKAPLQSMQRRSTAI
jgi:hypothetical protein